MFSTYSELVPIIITLIIILSIFVWRNFKISDLKNFDVKFSILGFLFGLLMTFMNFIYTNNVLFLLSPVITLSSLSYLRYRDTLLQNYHVTIPSVKTTYIKIIDILWWLSITIIIIIYYLSEIYTRHYLFFIFTTFSATLLSVRLFVTKLETKNSVFYMIMQVFILSLIIRSTAFFVSPYYIGSDPWAHAEYINYFMDFHALRVPSEFSSYYISYPLSHLMSIVTKLLSNLSIHEALFILSIILTFSTIFVLLIVKLLTGNYNIALLSILLLNLADSHLHWGIQVIAMSFGLAIYTILIYLFLKPIYTTSSKSVIYKILLVMFLPFIVWTHTVSAFILFFSIAAFLIGLLLYSLVYSNQDHRVGLTIFRKGTNTMIVLVTIMLIHWMSSEDYPFFDIALRGLIHSLSSEAEFLGRPSLSNITGTWEELIQFIGFCMYTFFGILGSLCCLSERHVNRYYMGLVIMVLSLFFVCYTFPVMGMENIVPSRWPAFANVTFVLFISIGLYYVFLSFKNKKVSLFLLTIFSLVSFFFMISGPYANQDSPVIGEQASLILVWSESEMKMYSTIDQKYNGSIVADEHTAVRPFETYLHNKNAKSYTLKTNGSLDLSQLSQGVIIWRKVSLNRPVACRDNFFVSPMLLGDKFHYYLNTNYNCIFDVDNAKAYIGNSKQPNFKN